MPSSLTEAAADFFAPDTEVGEVVCSSPVTPISGQRHNMFNYTTTDTTCSTCSDKVAKEVRCSRCSDKVAKEVRYLLSSPCQSSAYTPTPCAAGDKEAHWQRQWEASGKHTVATAARGKPGSVAAARWEALVASVEKASIVISSPAVATRFHQYIQSCKRTNRRDEALWAGLLHVLQLSKHAGTHSLHRLTLTSLPSLPSPRCPHCPRYPHRPHCPRVVCVVPPSLPSLPSHLAALTLPTSPRRPHLAALISRPPPSGSLWKK